jgi:hypothetical protein
LHRKKKKKRAAGLVLGGRGMDSVDVVVPDFF